MKRTGLLHLYYGDGKGKTTAAMGLALRAMGSGKRVVILQFLKGGKSGEVPLLEQLGAKVYRGKAGQKFVFQMNEAKRKPPASCRMRTSQLPWPTLPTC
mgnify:CR=1 FL=1